MMPFGMSVMPGMKSRSPSSGGMKDTVSGTRRRLQGLRPVGGSFPGASQVPRVGKEGRPRRGQGRRRGQSV